MGAQHKETQDLQVVFLGNLPHCEEIPQRLRHLAVVNIQKAIMQPVFCKNFAIACFALGNLIFMVRENQILAAGMDVNLLPQIFSGHHGTFNMPARPALTPRRLPVRLAFFLGLPKHEVKGVLLGLPSHLDIAVPGLQVVEVLVGELAIFLKFAGAEIDGAICRWVGVAFLY